MQLDSFKPSVYEITKYFLIIFIVRMQAAEGQNTGFLPVRVGGFGYLIDGPVLLGIGCDRYQNGVIDAELLHGTRKVSVGSVQIIGSVRAV